MGGRDDQATLRALRAVRRGEVDDVVAALRSARQAAPPATRRVFDERIVLLYVVAMRWPEAIAHAESTLVAHSSAYRAIVEDPIAALAAGVPASPAQPGGAPAALSPHEVGHVLGMSPPVWIELCAAYGRVGRLDHAAALAAGFERIAIDAIGMAWLAHRVRLVFLAAAGQPAAVDRLLAAPQIAQLRQVPRRYWAGLAAERAGDAPGAKSNYQAALVHARAAPHLQAHLARALADAERAQPIALSAAAAGVVAALGAREVVLPNAPTRTGPRVTVALIAANALVALVTALVVGSPGDLGAVVRAGGSLRSAVDLGEWWRVPTSVFVHVGWIHLIVNMLGLWSLGRIAESLFGPARTFAIYAAAGVLGAGASHLFGSASVSAGASGAIFGLCGALLLELAVAGKQYPAAGRRALLGALGFVTVVQLAIGFLYPIIDQWGHAVGLLGGALVGAALSPHGPAARLRGQLARGLAAIAVVLFAVAGALAATTDYTTTLALEGTRAVAVRGVDVTVPTSWAPEGDELVDPELFVLLSIVPVPTAELATQFETWRGDERSRARDRNFDEALAAPAPILALPAGWSSAELIATAADDLGAEQRYRVVLFAHAFDDRRAMVGALYMPDALAQDARARLVEILTSAHLAR
jgi:rhomboid protease GluP